MTVEANRRLAHGGALGDERTIQPTDILRLSERQPAHFGIRLPMFLTEPHVGADDATPFLERELRTGIPASRLAQHLLLVAEIEVHNDFPRDCFHPTTAV